MAMPLKMFFGVVTLCTAVTGHAAISVVNFKGDVISYEKTGNQIIVREVVKNPIILAGTTIKPLPKVEIKMEESDFRKIFMTQFLKINTNNLSVEQKKNVDDLLDALVLDMQGKNLKRTLRSLQDTKAFSVLENIRNIFGSYCSANEMSTAAVGTVCHAFLYNSWHVWYIAARVGKTIFIKDVESGLLVSGAVRYQASHYDAEAYQYCSYASELAKRGNLPGEGWHLPSGYPSEINGEYGFPDNDSEFVTLEKHGIRAVMDLYDDGSRYGVRLPTAFWSSSICPRYPRLAYKYFATGVILPGDRGLEGAVLCTRLEKEVSP